jgi:large subunit ribosomal protein L22
MRRIFMEFRASHRFARISARKARLVMDQVRGKGINEALDILKFSNKRASVMIDKVVRSAMANASMDSEVNVNRLFLSDARVDDGPLAQGRVRYRFRSRGGVVPIRKRTCHITVKLTPRPESAGSGEEKGKRKSGAKAKAGSARAGS